VRWSFLDGTCSEGSWFADGEAICFAYDDALSLQCWVFTFTEDGTLRATFEDKTPSEPLYEVAETDTPLMCQGPEIGV
jgi:hypothetical protein